MKTWLNIPRETLQQQPDPAVLQQLQQPPDLQSLKERLRARYPEAPETVLAQAVVGQQYRGGRIPKVSFMAKVSTSSHVYLGKQSFRIPDQFAPGSQVEVMIDHTLDPPQVFLCIEGASPLQIGTRIYPEDILSLSGRSRNQAGTSLAGDKSSRLGNRKKRSSRPALSGVYRRVSARMKSVPLPHRTKGTCGCTHPFGHMGGCDPMLQVLDH